MQVNVWSAIAVLRAAFAIFPSTREVDVSLVRKASFHVCAEGKMFAYRELDFRYGVPTGAPCIFTGIENGGRNLTPPLFTILSHQG